MRVLHFYRTFLPASFGGIEQVIYQLCLGCEAFDIHSEVLTLGRDRGVSLELYDTFPVHYAKTLFSVGGAEISVSIIRRFSELAANADVLHYHFPWPMADIVHLAASHDKPSVLTYHSDIVRQIRLYYFYRPLMHAFLKRVDAIVATSPNYLATSPVLARYRAKTRVIPIGLNPASYPAASVDRLAHWRERLPGRFFLFVGVLRYYKGLHILLDAARGAPYRVVIVGAGPIEDELKAHARRDAIDNVVFLGAIPDEDKVALLRLCYAVVFPSNLRAEAFGVSLLEGAMNGKPMISSEIGTGTSHVNVDGVTGFVVPPGDARALRAAMDRLIDAPALAASLGEGARARYLELFQAGQMCEAFAELYHELLARRAGERRLDVAKQ